MQDPSTPSPPSTRWTFRILGLLEVVIAGVLVYFMFLLPNDDEIHDRAGRVEKLAQHTSRQINSLRGKVKMLRERQPGLRNLAKDMQTQTDVFVTRIENQKLDFETVQTVSKALGEVSEGLEGFSQVLGDSGTNQLGKSFGVTADYLDKKVAPSAEEAASRLEKSLALMKEDAKRLEALSKVAPLDLKTASEVHTSLEKFAEGLEQLKATIALQNFDTMKEGFAGLETSLNTGADQVARLARYNYPVVTFNGFQPQVAQKPFWPDGRTIADGMRKAAKGATAAGKELETVGKSLPKLRVSLDESLKVAHKTRESLGLALKHQDMLAPVLKSIPEHSARLAKELPALGENLAKVLRDTAELKETAKLLREAEASMAKATAKFPQLEKNLGESAKLLRVTQAQLETTLSQREEYEKTLGTTLTLARSFAKAVPLFTYFAEADLAAQERSLYELRISVDEVGKVMPETADNATRMMSTIRMLLVFVAGIFVLHGLWIVAGTLSKGPTHGHHEDTSGAD